MLSLNVFEALRDDHLVLSWEAEFATTNYQLPHVLLDHVNVSAQG